MAQEKARKPVATKAKGPTAVLDDAHHGEIRGAFGTIGEHDHNANARRPWRRRLLALAVIMGPGLIVMVGDNDAGGVSTYAAAGQDYGPTLLWTLLLLIPVLIVNQEMVVRLGAVSGVGHGRLIFERFGNVWGRFAVGDLFVLNFLTIATEFIGIALGASYFGVPVVDRGATGRRTARRHHRQRALRDLGAADVRDPLRQSARHPVDVSLPSATR